MIQEVGHSLFIIALRRNQLIATEEGITELEREQFVTARIDFDQAIILGIDTQEQPKILLNQRLELYRQAIHTFSVKV